MAKSKKKISNVKLVYLLVIMILPIYASFAIQFVPRWHQGGYNGQGWPFIVCGPINQFTDVGLLLINASLITSAIYGLVILSAVVRRNFFHQAADGSRIKTISSKNS